MKQRTFAQGVHPPDRKTPTENQAITPLPPGKTVVIPLLQHTGAPAEALVKKGQRVLLGEKIGEAKGLISAPVHASVAGTVAAVESRPSPAGNPIPVVVIDNDGTDERAPRAGNGKAPADLSPDEVRQAVREAGIVGLGGAAFPTAVKLSPPAEHPVDTVVINGAECEPWLTCDYRLMLEKPGEVIAAAEIVMRTVGAKKVIFGIEANKSAALDLFAGKLSGRSDLTVAALKTKYPQGGEKMLIDALLGRQVPSGGLPFHVGVLVQNVGTLYAIWQALNDGLPLVERAVTVAGDAVASPGNRLVRIGTSCQEVLLACGGETDGDLALLLGGPMMGQAQWQSDLPVVKATSGLLLMRRKGPPAREYRCIRCNRCVGHCPMRLVPSRIALLVQTGDIATAREWGLLDCMECGSCAYVCPSAIPLVQWVRLGKAEVLRSKRQLEKKS